MEEGLLGPKISCFSKHKVTILISFLIIILVVVSIILIVVLSRKSDEESIPFKVIKNDADFIKPNISLNANFKLIKTKNGMTGLLINDPYAKYSLIDLHIPNGSFTETTPGLAHFGEHMVSGGSQNYPNIYPLYNPIIGGVLNKQDNAHTSGVEQVYYMGVPYNFLLEETIDMFMDSFKYPLYKEDVVKKEIQVVNAEFYLRVNSIGSLLDNFLRELSSSKTSFHGMTCGNNETLRLNESEILSKKLKGYHMEVKRPDNIFFSLYSNTDMSILEEYAKKYFTYTMHQYKDNEIDVEDKKKLIENAEKIEKIDIFDENLYKHGFYFNSNTKQNILFMFFNVGKIDYKNLKFDIYEYFMYLFYSKSLNNIFINNYVVDYSIENYIEIENNNVIAIIITLTKMGVEKLDEVLLIIYKYIEIIKKNGYDNKLFKDFIKYKKNKQILQFNKNKFVDISKDFLSDIIRNYRLFGVEQIFAFGTPKEENYNEENLKTFFNQFQYERSFFGANINTTVRDFKDKTFLESPIIKVYQYYKKEYLYGKIPEDLLNKIDDSNYDIENLNIRESNKYLSEKYENVIPCYKEKINKCSELNEFDIIKENQYKGTLLEENENYITVYQIDKSSESYIVNSYIEFDLGGKFTSLLELFLNTRLKEFNELNNIQIDSKNENNFFLKIKSFYDNTEILLEDIIKKIIKQPTENELNVFKNRAISNVIGNSEISLVEYTQNLYDEFIKGEKDQSKTDIYINILEQMTLKELQEDYETYILSNIKKIIFKIAGNIDKKLVESIHNLIKNNFIIKSENNILLNQGPKIEAEANYVINYYQKSELIDDPNNSILVKYKYEEEYYLLMIILSSCLDGYASPLLRFEYSNAYSPLISMDDNFFYIMEEGVYKEVTDMEDDINQVLYKMINGELECPNYLNIIKSFTIGGNYKNEKTPDNLFNSFISNNNLNNLKASYLNVPSTFKELVKMVSPIFINPKRFTFLVARPGISDEDFKKLIQNRKENAKYILNDSIKIEHTDDIKYWVNRK